MKINIIYYEDEPKISWYQLKGVLLQLFGRTAHIISKDPMTDDLSCWYIFFIEQQNNNWRFGYKSNCKFTLEYDMLILNNLLDKANQALAQKCSMDLSQEFIALDRIEPYSFGGLFERMNASHQPDYDNQNPNRDLDSMREILRNNTKPEEVEADVRLKNFILGIPDEILFIDETQPK
jgi:hypothetical protein